MIRTGLDYEKLAEHLMQYNDGQMEAHEVLSGIYVVSFISVLLR